MIKCKLFSGSFAMGYPSADERFNEWILSHQNIDILGFRYFQARYGDHSICIMYKEKSHDEQFQENFSSDKRGAD